MESEDALQTVDSEPSPTTFRSAPIEELTGQVKDIQNVMDDLMQEGTHYDDVTGNGRMSLLQPGAEKLCFAFQFAPSFDTERTDIPPEDVPNAEDKIEGHREYEVRCRLTHRPSGKFVGEGSGSCSTLESKYRYRTVDETTDVGVPSDFWDSYDKDADENMGDADFSILEDALINNGVDIPEGADVGVTKNDDGEWRITIEMKGENPDIADLYNTVLKMAEKRALVNAVKRATAASDIFTQDTEDLAQLSGSDVQGQRKRRPNGQKSKKKPLRVEWEAPHGQSFKVQREAKRQLDRFHNGLTDYEGTDLAAMIEKVRTGCSGWTGVEADALSHLLSYHEQRDAHPDAGTTQHQGDEKTDPRAHTESGKETGQGPTPQKNARSTSQSKKKSTTGQQGGTSTEGRKYDGPEDAISRLCPNAMEWGGKDIPEDRRISEKQLNRFFAIADDHDWKESWLDRFVKDELGYESKKEIPWGDPYDEVCAALEDQEFRYWMSRDTSVKDMFEDDDSNEPFEEGTDDSAVPF